MRKLKTPLSDSDVRGLNLGEIVFLSGEIFTARDLASARIIELAASARYEEIPIERGAVIYHCGPLVKRKRKERKPAGEEEEVRSGSEGSAWEIISAGPTTSARMNAVMPKIIEILQVRAIIGKGGMNAATREAMRRQGCVYLAFTGGAGVLAASKMRVLQVYWEDLGLAEAVWHLSVENFGPLVVSIDANGESLYEKVLEEAKKGKHLKSLSSKSINNFN